MSEAYGKYEDDEMFEFAVFSVMELFHVTYEYVMDMPATRFMRIAPYSEWKNKLVEETIERAKRKR